MPRIALGLSYAGTHFEGWQSQASGKTGQDALELALKRFTQQRISTLCAGRTDSGVHALMQVVHFDTDIERAEHSWVRACNSELPPSISVEWACTVPREFHCRAQALTRRYSYILKESAVRPSVDASNVGWIMPKYGGSLDGEAMAQAAQMLLGEHDFSAYRASSCQALSPVKTMLHIGVHRKGAYWRFDFEASAFLHHMIRNIMGCLIYIGLGKHPASWMKEVLESRSRDCAAPTFSPSGLYFLGPTYDEIWGLPQRTDAFDALPVLGRWS